MNEAFYTTIESTNLEKNYADAKDYFMLNGIDINDYTEDDIFLSVLYDIFFIQTSVFEPVQGFKRKILVPPRYNEKCQQLHLLRYKIPDKHSTVRTTKSSHHYHALRHTKTLGGIGLYFCTYCGKLLS